MTFEELGDGFRSTLLTIGEAVIVLTPGQKKKSLLMLF